MRAAPAFQVSLHRFGFWRGAVIALAAVAAAALTAWLTTGEAPIGMAGGFGAATALAAILALTASLLRVPACDLRWNGSTWTLARKGAEPVTGALLVAVDLGGWMLLRFIPARPATLGVWLPVQRRGLESQWHALRCSVYAPQPAPGDEATEP
jgi:hypothetical protein